MTFSVAAIAPADLEEATSVIFRAYQGKNTYVNSVHPKNLTKEGQVNALQKLRKVVDKSEKSRWEKVTDETTGRIVGTAIWLIYEHAKPVNALQSKKASETAFGNEDAEFAAALSGSLVGMEAPFWENNEVPLINLFVMTVEPEHQCHGVGTLLMKSGTKLADNIGAKCSVMATEAAQKLYEKSGFVVERNAVLQVPEKFANRPAVRLLHMIRERKAHP